MPLYRSPVAAVGGLAVFFHCAARVKSHAATIVSPSAYSMPLRSFQPTNKQPAFVNAFAARLFSSSSAKSWTSIAPVPPLPSNVTVNLRDGTVTGGGAASMVPGAGAMMLVSVSRILSVIAGVPLRHALKWMFVPAPA